ncbi:hypothetical protein F751_0968 [Auxenochlorella protothecoides]|uniref:Uncharacterized protein n=1 Tax=Auxenochlorella protothecoides TaxID=3075 RepID=A0A087SQZ9_AUXPR|nr:hypothetical protein F751_0968 [Auxenochlorella protothecoides]KFM28153.1 hypothetical protein F751_0968 [Auxenochlorella protothecoides]
MTWMLTPSSDPAGPPAPGPARAVAFLLAIPCWRRGAHRPGMRLRPVDGELSI